MPLVLLTATLLFGLARAPMPPQETTLPPPPPPTTTSALTTIPPTTIDPSSCEYEGKIYKNGEDIERDSENCYGMYCDYGSIVAWDAACFFSTSPCSGVNVDVPGQCCPDCIETTTPAKTTTPIPTPTLPKGCLVNGTFYEIGKDIPQKNPCKHCTCTKEYAVLCSLTSCGPVHCVNPRKKRGECCPTCPSGPNCWYGRRKIKVGETYKPKPNIYCSCPEPYEPLACCKKIPENQNFLKKKLKRERKFMNPTLRLYIEKHLGL